MRRITTIALVLMIAVVAAALVSGQAKPKAGTPATPPVAAQPAVEHVAWMDLAKTPPMGWNSWNQFGCNVSEQLIRESADAMVNSGMKEAGYQYVVIDDCWQVSRDKNGTIVPDEKRFASGMKALADYIHSKGLRFGVYSDAGARTCQGRPGSNGYEQEDARQYAAWGVDYLKYDWCNNDGVDPKIAYPTMRDALKAAGRPIVFSMCEWGSNKPWLWARGVGHLW
ncbi:MAG: glycoside hydrolase family 27 protein, partial [Bacteroidales bacterium]